MEYYVYILSNISRTIYIGVANDLQRRMFEHKSKIFGGFTKKYNITILVYFEITPDILSALHREKQLKGWNRAKKIALIEQHNPYWQVMSAQWF